MECQVRSMASSSLSNDVSIPEGKVESVCRQWLVREDGVLAYKLQSEEIERHYGHNKETSQILRSDLLEAKSAQKTEEEEAATVQLAYERMLQEQEDQDAFLAQQLQEKILKEDLEHQKQIEEEDKKIALELQKKEKLRLQRKRELRQAEKARAELSNTSSIKSMEDVLMKSAATSPLDSNFSLLSLEPPDNLSPEEFQQFVQQRDQELARLLQKQDAKNSNVTKNDQQIAIEAQDHELARILQEQERTRARKAKERARQRAQQQEHGKSFDSRTQSPESTENASFIKERVRSPPEWSTPPRRYFASDDPMANVAAAIDPTYNHSSPSTSSSLSSPSTPVTDKFLIPDMRPYTSSISALEEDFLNNTDGSVAPPYMPIQGTRRPSTLEKSKKSRKTKDGCKTQ